jgi:quinol monooxygenase YgiN
MYGSIAHLLKPGRDEELRQREQEMAPPILGFVSQHMYRMDADPNELYLVVAFENEQAYRDNAESPEQHQRYEQFRTLLDADPEWQDREIIDTYPGSGTG